GSPGVSNASTVVIIGVPDLFTCAAREVGKIANIDKNRTRGFIKFGFPITKVKYTKYN
ncbi:MAG: hypothetical protein IH593_01530, partial [Bacteroidales bacterium]|nr:hypothetical protein [Bacteroidales bacterium]